MSASNLPPSAQLHGTAPSQKMMDEDWAGSGLATIDGRILLLSDSCADLLGYMPEECVGMNLSDIAESDGATLRPIGQLTRGEVTSVRTEECLRRKDGSLFFGRVSASLMADEHTAKPKYLLLQIENLELRKLAAKAAVDANEDRWNIAMEGAGQGVWDIDLHHNTAFYSRRWREMRGIGLNEVVDGSVDTLLARVHPEDREHLRAHLGRFISTEEKQNSVEYRERHRDGHYIWILSRGRAVEFPADGTVVRFVGTDTDITALKEKEAVDAALAAQTYRSHLAALEKAHEAAESAQQLAQSLARHDALTGLPNRRVFAESMEASVARANRGAGVYAILIFDLDRFKPINDMHGHAVGDFVLTEIAKRLGEVVRKSDTLARLGGDEFAVILECTSGETAGDAAMRLAERIIEAVNRPITSGEQIYSVGASVGIAICPADGSDPESLIRAADMAMYRAKADGRGTFCFFEPSMEADLRAKVALEDDVRQAISAENITPHYQPLMKLAENKLVGFEILARWDHSERGSVPPDTFIPIVEKLGLIGHLTYSLLRRACLDAKGWPSELTLALNVSPLHFVDPLLPVKLLAVLSETGFSSTRLEIEVTESALMTDIDTARAVLVSLQALGIKISLDDFGTGFSSLYRLRELRFDKIKIDRSFVLAMEKDPESAQIVHSVIALAKSLGLPTIAEGIEQLATMRQIIEEGGEYGQGFYFGKAMTAGEATKLANVRGFESSALLAG